MKQILVLTSKLLAVSLLSILFFLISSQTAFIIDPRCFVGDLSWGIKVLYGYYIYSAVIIFSSLSWLLKDRRVATLLSCALLFSFIIYWWGSFNAAPKKSLLMIVIGTINFIVAHLLNSKSSNIAFKKTNS